MDNRITQDSDADRPRVSRAIGEEDGRSDGGAVRPSRRGLRASLSAHLVVLSVAAVLMGASVLATRKEASRPAAPEPSTPEAAAATVLEFVPRPAADGRGSDGEGDAVPEIVVCVDESSCDAARQDLGIPYYYRGDFSPYYGCMVKEDVAFFGRGGSGKQLATPSDGEFVRSELRRFRLSFDVSTSSRS